ncbi:MAG TPA: YitT family protein [Candidatus Limiplasma pullistercoris]|nr:YitT family protein [Candidatus Limiplasma pullistercoris]
MRKNLLKNEQLASAVQIALGCALGALAYPLFLVPNHIAPGGLTGLATVLNYLFRWPVGTTSLVMNVPLFIIGYRAMGRVFVIRSLVATVLFSVLIDLIPLPPMTEQPLLGAVFGGVLLGAGLGLILRGGATTGGTDMVARMIHNRFQHISVGAFLFLIDCCVVLMAGFFIEAEYALYAFVALYAASKLIDVVMVGLTREKACYIISTQHEQVKREIMEKLDRGVTVLHAEGGYSGQERPVLLCVLSAQELGRLKAIVREADEDAFLFISDAHEVLGEGFRKLME